MAQFQASFIPKKTPQAVQARNRPKMNLGLVGAVAAIIFSLALVASIGVFVYQKIVESSIASKEETLVRERAAFELATIKELARLDIRINAASELLANHAAPSEVFALLEQLTLQNVRFDAFTLKRSTGGGYEVEMSGQAKSFNALALQSEVLADEDVLRSPIFSNFNLDESGNVIFSMSASVDPAFLSYNSLFNESEQLSLERE